MNAEIGKYGIIARKGKDSEDWFIACVTDDTKRELEIPLSFLEDYLEYEVIIYQDGENGDYLTNPIAYQIKRVNSKSKLKLWFAKVVELLFIKKI